MVAKSREECSNSRANLSGWQRIAAKSCNRKYRKSALILWINPSYSWILFCTRIEFFRTNCTATIILEGKLFLKYFAAFLTKLLLRTWNIVMGMLNDILKTLKIFGLCYYKFQLLLMENSNRNDFHSTSNAIHKLHQKFIQYFIKELSMIQQNHKTFLLKVVGTCLPAIFRILHRKHQTTRNNIKSIEFSFAKLQLYNCFPIESTHKPKYVRNFPLV